MERLRCALRTALRSNEFSFALISFLWRLRDALQPRLDSLQHFLSQGAQFVRAISFATSSFIPFSKFGSASSLYLAMWPRRTALWSNPLRTGGGHASLTSACAFRACAACPSLLTSFGRRRYGSPFWAFFNLCAILPSRREKWPRPRFLPMPIVRWEMPARLDTSEHLLRRLLFDSLP